MMNKQFRILSILFLVVSATVFLAAGAKASPNDKLSSANKGINQSNAPVPTPLLNGKKVFVSFDPGDVIAFPTIYSGGPERAYSELYAGLKQWGHYQLALDPQEADLIFSVRFVENGLQWPQIRLVISDAKTHVILWGFVEQVDGIVFKKHRDQGFSNAVKWLVNDVQALVAPGTPQPFQLDDADKRLKQ